MFGCPFDCGRYREDMDLLICRPKGDLDEDRLRGMSSCINCFPETALKAGKRFFDLREIQSIKLGLENFYCVKAMGIPQKTSNDRVVECFLVSNQLLFGMIRMYESVMERPGLEIHVSYNIQELATILDVDASALSNTED